MPQFVTIILEPSPEIDSVVISNRRRVAAASESTQVSNQILISASIWSDPVAE